MKTQRRYSSNQKIFDAGIKHLKLQNSRSIDTDRICLYRSSTKNAKACIVGAFIKDNEYIVGMENNPVEDLPSLLVGKKKYKSLHKWIRTHENFLIDLQKLHDNSGDCSKFIETVKCIADTYYLTVDLNQLEKDFKNFKWS